MVPLRVRSTSLAVHTHVLLFFRRGKVDRHDVYQAPYIWVQFTKPKPNVLINVICRVFGQNIDFDRKAGRALTRFQIYVKESSKRAGSRRVPDS